MGTDFGTGRIEKLLLRVSVPIIITLCITELYNMADSVFVGRAVGAYAVGGLAIVYPLQRILIALSSMIGIGTSASFTKARGANDSKKAGAFLWSGFGFILIFMSILCAFLFMFRSEVVTLLGASGPLYAYALEYSGPILIGAVFLAMTLFATQICTSLGRGYVGIVCTAAGAGINIFLDAWLVLGLNMGVQGAAIATMMSQIISALIALSFLFMPLKQYPSKNQVKRWAPLVGMILMVGFASFIVEAEEGIVMAIFNTVLQSIGSEASIVVLAASTKIYMFLFIFMFGIASGMQPIVAYNVGAKNHQRVSKTLSTAIRYGAGLTLVLWALTLIFAPQLIGLFITDPDILAMTIPAYRIMVSCFPLVSVYYIAIFYFQAHGDVKLSLALSVLRQLVLMVPIALFCVYVLNMGPMGVWIAYPISDCIVVGVSVMALLKQKKAPRAL